MAQSKGSQSKGRAKSGPGPRDPAYDLMLRLDRLEELREDMDELGVESLAQLDHLIEELHQQLGDT